MTSVPAWTGAGTRPGAAAALLRPVADGLVVAKRNVIKIKRVPDMIGFIVFQPIMFVLLFAYVFGGAISAGNPEAYREFLIAGIFTQTVVFGATFTGYGLAQDIQKGIIDRFRTLPMSPSAVLTGRTFSDVLTNVLVLVVMSLTGLLVGWRIDTSVAEAALGFLLLLVFAYAISWVMAFVGMLVPSPEVVNNAAFVVIFPLTFIANTFVPLRSLPGPLQAFAEWNPVSTVTHASRELFGNYGPGLPSPEPSWALQHAVLYTVLWAVAVLIVFVPLANAQYRRSTSR